MTCVEQPIDEITGNKTGAAGHKETHHNPSLIVGLRANITDEPPKGKPTLLANTDSIRETVSSRRFTHPVWPGAASDGSSANPSAVRGAVLIAAQSNGSSHISV